MATGKDNAVGVTVITGLDDYIITGRIDQRGPIIGALDNGEEYCYNVIYVDASNGNDYETGRGTWNASTNTLTRDSIKTSSNSDNSVNWGSGQKMVQIVEDFDLLCDMEKMVEGATKKILTVAERSNIATMKSKVDLITITQAVDLDTMEAQINAAVGGMRYRGNWDASSGVFPGGGMALLGDFYYCSVSGTVDGNEFTAGDNIVALVNNASISTYAGNWSKHDQTDAVQSVAGLVGTITETQLRAAIHVPDPFWYKSPGEPLLVLAIGDSNMIGIGDSSGTLTLNSNVYVRSTPGTSAWSAADLAWFNNSVVDPAGSAFPNPASAPTSFTGVLRNNNGDTGYAAATRLQQATGRDVYLFQTACGGKTMAYWLPGGGAGKEGMNALTAQLPAVFATSGLPEFFDVVIMSDSTNDAGTSVTPATFVANFTTMYDHMVSEGWINPNYTKWFQLEAPQVYQPYAGWLGLQLLSQTFGERVSIISSVDLATNGDNVHFTGLSCQELGFRSSDAALGSLVTKPLIRPGAYIETVAGLTTNLACNGFNLTGVNVIHGAATANTPITVRVGGDSAYDMVYTPSDALMATSLRTGGPNGAWFMSRMTGSAGFPAFQLRAENTLSGASILLSLGDAADVNRVTVSRTGLVASKGGYSTTAASSFGNVTEQYTTLTIPTDTVTALSTPSLLLNGQLTHNFSGAYVGHRISVAETHIIQQNSVFDAGSIFSAASIIKNLSSATIAFAGPPSFRGANTFQADTTGSTLGFVIDFHSTPTFDRVNSGTLAVFTVRQHGADITVNTGATVTNRQGYSVSDKTGSGSITSQAGFSSNLSSSGATNSTHLLMGTNTIPAGNFGIYQYDTFVNRWNGGHRMAYREATAATVTVTTADCVIKLNRGTAQTVDLPDATTCQGLVLYFKRVGAGTPTLSGNGTQTIDGVTTLAIGMTDHTVTIVSDGSNWLLLHTGAP